MSQTFYAALVLAGGASYGIISTLVKLSYRSGFSINDVSSIQYFLGFFLLWTIWLLRVRRFPAKKTALAFLLTGIPLSGTTMLRLLSIAIVLAGTVLGAGVIGSAAAFPLSAGMLWGFAAAISYTTGLLCMNRIGRGIHPITKSALMVSGALVMVLLFLPPDLPVSPAHFASILPYGIPLTLFGVFLPPLLFSSGMPHISPGLGSLLAASELPAALFFSFLLLGESISFLQTIGIVMILFGIWLGNRKHVV